MTEIRTLQRRDRPEPDAEPTYQPDLEALDREFGAITRKVNEFAPKHDDGIDPIIRGLLTHLPPAGSVWPAEDRKLWLELLERSFRIVFKDKPAKTERTSAKNAQVEPAAEEQPPGAA